MSQAPVTEIFSSIQGEGPWVGQRQIFVRFSGCDIACRYCDTPVGQGNGTCRVQKDSASSEHEIVPGRISSQQLTAYCSRLAWPGPGRPVLSLTGGEPLLHSAFLALWLPEVASLWKIYLETNGIRNKAMYELRDWIDVVSMDFKLPSATGLREYWKEHQAFLAAAEGTTIFGKAVVTLDTPEEEIIQCAQLAASHNNDMTLVIQPADGPRSPSTDLLIALQQAALSFLGDVRIIPQVHKMMNLP